MVDDLSYFPVYLFLLVFFKILLVSFVWTSFCYNNFQYPFKPKGAGTFSTALNFIEEHSDYAMFYYYYKRTDPMWVDYQSRPQNGQSGQTLYG